MTTTAAQATRTQYNGIRTYASEAIAEHLERVFAEGVARFGSVDAFQQALNVYNDAETARKAA